MVAAKSVAQTQSRRRGRGEGQRKPCLPVARAGNVRRRANSIACRRERTRRRRRRRGAVITMAVAAAAAAPRVGEVGARARCPAATRPSSASPWRLSSRRSRATRPWRACTAPSPPGIPRAQGPRHARSGAHRRRRPAAAASSGGPRGARRAPPRPPHTPPASEDIATPPLDSSGGATATGASFTSASSAMPATAYPCHCNGHRISTCSPFTRRSGQRLKVASTRRLYERIRKKLAALPYI